MRDVLIDKKIREAKASVLNVVSAHNVAQARRDWEMSERIGALEAVSATWRSRLRWLLTGRVS